MGIHPRQHYQLYQDKDVIRRSLSLPFNVETEWKEAGWGEADVKREEK